MKRVKEHDEQIGYFTFVQNSQLNDYLKLAYACGLSLKATQSINKFAIAVDKATKEQLTEKHYKVFDYVIDIPWGDDSKDDSWKLGNEWKAWSITPFKETVKLDCDMVFTRNIDHWWTFMREQEVMIATNVRKLDGTISDSRKYRKLFDINNLPNIYSGFMYFRYGEKSQKLFRTLKWVYKNWDEVSESLKNYAGISSKATFIGQGFYFQIWEPNAAIIKQKESRKRLVKEKKSLSAILIEKKIDEK